MTDAALRVRFSSASEPADYAYGSADDCNEAFNAMLDHVRQHGFSGWFFRGSAAFNMREVASFAVVDLAATRPAPAAEGTE